MQEGASVFTADSPGHYRLQAPLRIDSVRGLRLEGQKLLAAAPQELTVDLSGVPAADSAGLALLIDWLASARALGKTLRYRQLPPALASLARLSEVESLLTP